MPPPVIGYVIDGLKSMMLVVFVIFLLACIDTLTFTARYRIANGTGHAVELRFYKAILADQERNFVFKVDIEGEGLVLERTLKTYPPDTNGPIDAYKADSVAVIFNKERVEGHILTEPEFRSIMNISGYQSNEEGNDYIYTITETNFNNATPCDGTCN
jgi:hypothetical protein